MTESTIEDWAVNIKSIKEIINHPDRQNMHCFLESCGANFEVAKENKESLQKWSNVGNRDAMEAIWGKERWSYFRKWTKNYVYQYEATTYIHQGRVGQNRHVGSGEIRPLCLMTRYAAFDNESDKLFSDRRFSLEIGIRSINGELRERGVDLKDFRKLARPDTGEVYRPGSFPPGYLDALVYEMSQWRR